MTNQLKPNWQKKEDTSVNRYFHFSGYQSQTGQRIDRYANIAIKSDNAKVAIWNKGPTIPYELPEDWPKLQSHEEKIRVVNK